MESLCSSSASPGGIEACLYRQPTSSPSLVKAPTLLSRGSRGPGKVAFLTLSCPPQRRGKRWAAVAREVSGGVGENDRASVNGTNVLIDSAPPLIEGDSQIDGNGSCKREKMEVVTPATFENGKTGSKAGLFRTPILGGVQSATSVYNLPRPALAVRNLMEQAKFGQLCTTMSRMHHNRAGYPVGSLVDFVSDSMGHPIFSLSPLAIHTRNILVNCKCSLLVQIPGWSSLSNARVTIFGDVIPLAADDQGDSQIDGNGSCKREKMEVVTPATFENGKTGSKAGLFRTPILGGVQSATSVYNLPRPALAVRNLMEQAKFGQLCTTMSRMHHNRAGYPVGSLVDFVSDSMGHPIFSLSPLAIHTRNILVNCKCSLLVQIPGWSSLSNARVTIFGDVIPLAADDQMSDTWIQRPFMYMLCAWRHFPTVMITKKME